jgi:glycosyltransferase involved in cell wall biosynthesis
VGVTTTVAPAASSRAGKLHMRPMNKGNRDSPCGEKCYNILHVGKYYPPHMGGIEIYLQSLVRHQAQDCRVKVIVANDGIRTVHERKDGAELLRLSCLGTIKSMPLCPALPWHLGRAQADVVHMHMPNPAAAFAYIVSGCQIPLVLTHHSDTIGREKIRRLSEPFVQEAMRRASRIIVSSRQYADTSVELESYHDKIEVIPHGIDPAKHAVAEPEAVRRIQSRYGPGIAIAIGRLVPFKGFEILIRAMQTAPGNLLLIGDGPLRKHLEAVSKECGTSQRVFFMGKIDNSQIANYLSAADVFSMPSISRAESFGIVQLEAMAAGVPVVNTNIDSGVPEVSLDGITGITVPPGDAHALAHALTALLTDREKRLRMGEAGKARVRGEFSEARMSTRTMRVYEEILSVNAVQGACQPVRWHQAPSHPQTPIQKNDKPATSREADCPQNS